MSLTCLSDYLSVCQEGPFVYMSLVGTVETSEGPLAELCEFYFILLHFTALYFTAVFTFTLTPYFSCTTFHTIKH